jgi:hypothetical protein
VLVVGSPQLDFGALERVAVYQGGYSPDSQAVRWFWEVLPPVRVRPSRPESVQVRGGYSRPMRLGHPSHGWAPLGARAGVTQTTRMTRHSDGA